MRHEFAAAGTPIHVVALNATSAVVQQPELVSRCSFPLLQDTPEVDSWGAHGGKKDDIYVYDASGTLRAYLPVGVDGAPTNLSTPEGYATVKDAIKAAFQ